WARSPSACAISPRLASGPVHWGRAWLRARKLARAASRSPARFSATASANCCCNASDCSPVALSGPVRLAQPPRPRVTSKNRMARRLIIGSLDLIDHLAQGLGRVVAAGQQALEGRETQLDTVIVNNGPATAGVLFMNADGLFLKRE